MTLLDSFPHKCSIRRRTTTKGTLGDTKTSYTTEQTGVLCWEQSATHNEIQMFEKRGMHITRKVYFTSDPGVTERHEILITERNGTTVSSPLSLDVKSEALPDAAAGLGVVYKVMVDYLTGRDD